MADKSVVAWDIGGAHIKLAYRNATGKLEMVAQYPCPLWKGTQQLQQALQAILSEYSFAKASHVVTMSGELSDIFTSRHDGVVQIGAMITEQLSTQNVQDIRFYAAHKGFVSSDALAQHAEDIASANWHATAQSLTLQMEQGVLVDMGSTTTDIIAFQGGKVATSAVSDSARLLSGELLYTGLNRTPVMAIADSFEVQGRSQPVMAELFANTADVYRLLDLLPEASDYYPSCDGSAKDMVGSARRIARMFGYDYQDDLDKWKAFAQAIAKVQQAKIAKAIQVVTAPLSGTDIPIVALGVGQLIVTKLAQEAGYHLVDAGQLWGLDGNKENLQTTQAIECATVLSLAHLAEENQDCYGNI